MKNKTRCCGFSNCFFPHDHRSGWDQKSLHDLAIGNDYRAFQHFFWQNRDGAPTHVGLRLPIQTHSETTEMGDVPSIEEQVVIAKEIEIDDLQFCTDAEPGPVPTSISSVKRDGRRVDPMNRRKATPIKGWRIVEHFMNPNGPTL